MLKKTVAILVFMLALSGCSEEVDKSSANNSTTATNYLTKSTTGQTNTTMNISIEPRVSKGLQGDFTNVTFSIQEHPGQAIIKDKLNCTLSEDLTASCNYKGSLDKLKPGSAYRIILYSQNVKNPTNANGLACDYFVYDGKQVPNIVITPSSSGACILWQLKSDTGYSEEEIRNRVRNILNDDSEDDYDLETTLYDVYKFYDNRYDWQQAWKMLVELIQNNKPLPKNEDSTINTAGRLF